jgi:monoamine oxidase
MARTPLFRNLVRSLQLARAANRLGRPAREIVELHGERHARGWTRRDLIATGALAGAGLALGCAGAPRPRPSGAAGGREVAIVGAGIAGLVCAHRLTQAGVPARVYEAQRRVGGRIWSLRGGFPEDQVCELGGELVDTPHRTMHALCAELGLELDDFAGDDPSLRSETWWFGGRAVPDAEVVEAFRPLAARIDAVWEALPGETVSYRESAGAEAIDRRPLSEWLRAQGVQGWFYDLLDVAYTTEYGLELDEQSPWNLLALISTEPDPFRIFGESDERFHVRGGNDLVTTRLAERLDGRIETGFRLEALTRAADGSHRLAFRVDGASREVAADRVVLTLPFTKLREVSLDLPLPAAKRRAIDELGYGTNAKLMVGFSERIWRTRHGSNGSVLTDLPFQLAWESTRLQPGGGGIVVLYGGGRRGIEMGEGTPAAQAERLAASLDRVFPGVAALRTHEVRFHWPGFEWARGSYACYRPGQWTTIAGAEGEAVGNLFFAGEHTSADFQGFMEGGAETGSRAAREVLESLDLPVPETLREVASGAAAPSPRAAVRAAVA